MITNQLNVFINILILLAISVGAPTIAVGILALFKIKITKNSRIFLYSFAAGIILILGTIGFIAEAIHHSKEHFSDPSKAINILQVVGIVGGGMALGLGGVLGIRYLITRNKHEIHEHHEMHDHNDHIFNSSDVDNKKIKWLPILLLITHRCVDGITLGFMANTHSGAIGTFDNWGMIIVFAIHLIPTTIIIYLIQLDIQDGKRWKAFLVTVGMLLLMVPFTLIGGFLITNIQKIWWLMPLLFSISGAILTIMSIMELLPEFIHFRNSKTKTWIGSIGLFVTGILLAVILICIHTH
ncbi:hypothetical protein [Ureaplasma ceti]|uniref:ZIP Zinc transporter n=1 Tax=Ureaplasma ceti TaxID=3119530 RepID=A0ABP9U7Q4_9BACT